MGELKEIRQDRGSDRTQSTGYETSATTTIARTAELLGVSRNLAYQLVARDGEIAGVKAISVGRRIVIPSAPLRAALGLDDERESRDEQTDRA